MGASAPLQAVAAPAVQLPPHDTHEGTLRARTGVPLDRSPPSRQGSARGADRCWYSFPPSFAFDWRVVARFFDTLRLSSPGDVVCGRVRLVVRAACRGPADPFRVARVAGSAAGAGRGTPGGWRGLAYYRFHGSPRRYWSKYDDAFMGGLHGELAAVSSKIPVWCILDNTATERGWRTHSTSGTGSRARAAAKLSQSRATQLPVDESLPRQRPFMKPGANRRRCASASSPGATVGEVPPSRGRASGLVTPR